MFNFKIDNTLKRPLILITNDDGYRAKGIQSLIEAASPFGDIIVVAPNNSKSGMSHAITVKEILRLNVVSEEPGLKVYRCSGTPVDCVKLAIRELDIRPDLLLSGINHGSNASVSVHYSGTMGAAKEGCICGIPSIGISLDDFSSDADFSQSQAVVSKIIPQVLEHGLPHWVCLNVNVPKVDSVKGIKVCRQANGAWQERFDKRVDQSGQNYYWLTGEFLLKDAHDAESDEAYLRQAYASVVPTTVDTTSYEMLDKMQSWDL